MSRIIAAIALVAISSVAGAQAIPVTLSEWKIEMPRDTVRAGAVTFRVTNGGAVTHRLHVRGEGVDKGTRDIGAKEVASLTVTVKVGTYELFCPMSENSHKMAGMSRTLVVIAGDSTAAKKKSGE